MCIRLTGFNRKAWYWHFFEQDIAPGNGMHGARVVVSLTTSSDPKARCYCLVDGCIRESFSTSSHDLAGHLGTHGITETNYRQLVRVKHQPAVFAPKRPRLSTLDTEANAAFARFTASQHLAVNVLATQEFKDLVESIQKHPTWKAPSVRRFKRTILPEMVGTIEASTRDTLCKA